MKTQYILKHTYQELYYDGLTGWGGVVAIARNVDLQDQYIFDTISDAEEVLKEVSFHGNSFQIIEYKPIRKPKRTYEPYYTNIPKLNKGVKNEFCVQCGINILVDEKYLEWFNKPICLHCVMNNLEGILESYAKVEDNLKDEWEASGSETFKKFIRKLTI